MGKSTTIRLCGLERELPLCTTPTGIKVFGFNPLGDVELIEAVARDLCNKAVYDIILTSECKGIVFAHAIARRAGVQYCVLRKENKCYLGESVRFIGGSITSGHQEYFLSDVDVRKLAGKRILIVDDVYSTGSTLEVLMEVARQCKATPVAAVCALRESPTSRELEFQSHGIPIYVSGFLPLP